MRTTIWRRIGGFALAVAAIYACAISVDVESVMQAFAGARLQLVIVAVASVIVTLALVTLRWGLLLQDHELPSRWRVLWDAVIVGQAVNIVVPLRFGEGARLALTCRGLGVPIGRATVALALERTFDLTAFAAANLLVAVFGVAPQAWESLPSHAPALLVAAAATAGVAALIPFAVRSASRHQRMPAFIRRWLDAQRSAMEAGWHELTSGRRIAVISTLTVVIVLAAASTNLIIMRAFAVPVPAVAAIVLLLALQAGTALVSVPGNIGVFHYITVVTLGFWGVPRPTALAVAIVLHIVSLGPKVVLGSLAMVMAPAIRTSFAHQSSRA